MEPVVFDRSPLADYLRGALLRHDVCFGRPGLPRSRQPPEPVPEELEPEPKTARSLTIRVTDEGEDVHEAGWAQPEADADIDHESSPPSSPGFAPTGRPMVRSRFRNKNPDGLKVDVSSAATGSSKASLHPFRRSYSTAVASRIDRADNSKFLEQFRYTIVASQLLNGHTIAGHGPAASRPPQSATIEQNGSHELLNPAGVAWTVLGALALALAISWLSGSGAFTRKRLVAVLLLVAVTGAVAQVFMRRQWLRYRRHQALAEMSGFVSNAQEFDSATSAALALIQEVELVSRGYRITPLPPISRIEDRTQARRCLRLRKALKGCFADVLHEYSQTCSVVKGFSEQLDLEKYYDIYDISDLDVSDAQQALADLKTEDAESLRTLKISAARFHTVRKMFLCSLLALDASGESSDLLRWTTAVEALRALNSSTSASYERLRTILSEEESFPVPVTPKVPLTPGRERWRGQMRKLNGLSTGIRGLQAKLQLLREESDKTLNESDDISELGTNLTAQYESIGVDLKALMQAWEEGKAALAVGIDRNEKRLSSMSTLLSPASSLSGPTAIEEGGGSASDALKALSGESPSGNNHFDVNINGGDSDEIFEAVALPRPRSLLTREERIAKMKEEREKKETVKERNEASRGMLKELEMVINHRPRPRTNTTPTPVAPRVTSP